MRLYVLCHTGVGFGSIQTKSLDFTVQISCANFMCESHREIQDSFIHSKTVQDADKLRDTWFIGGERNCSNWQQPERLRRRTGRKVDCGDEKTYDNNRHCVTVYWQTVNEIRRIPYQVVPRRRKSRDNATKDNRIERSAVNQELEML